VVAYPSIAEVPGPVDLAVVAVPAAAVVWTAQECAAAGVRALVVVSAGFAEAGPEGAARQAQLGVGVGVEDGTVERFGVGRRLQKPLGEPGATLHRPAARDASWCVTGSGQRRQTG
jgi:hypothetical protein